VSSPTHRTQYEARANLCAATEPDGMQESNSCHTPNVEWFRAVECSRPSEVIDDDGFANRVPPQNIFPGDFQFPKLNQSSIRMSRAAHQSVGFDYPHDNDRSSENLCKVRTGTCRLLENQVG
jgi:hypothetical protein